MRDVGGIADDAVKLSQSPVRPLQGIHRHGDHPARQGVPAGVLAADPQGPVGKLAQYHMGLRGLRCQRQTDAAAAGAQVQHPAVAQGLHIGQRLIHQHLRIRPGNQHLLGDIQRQAVKLPLTDEIRHRLSRQMTGRQLPHPAFQLRRGVQPPVPGQLLPGLVDPEAGQLPGLQGGVDDAALLQFPANIQKQVIICDRHASSQSPLNFVSACGKNCVHSLAPPFSSANVSLVAEEVFL